MKSHVIVLPGRFRVAHFDRIVGPPLLVFVHTRDGQLGADAQQGHWFAHVARWDTHFDSTSTCKLLAENRTSASSIAGKNVFPRSADGELEFTLVQLSENCAMSALSTSAFFPPCTTRLAFSYAMHTP